jgi:hypothetical protein
MPYVTFSFSRCFITPCSLVVCSLLCGRASRQGMEMVVCSVEANFETRASVLFCSDLLNSHIAVRKPVSVGCRQHSVRVAQVAPPIVGRSYSLSCPVAHDQCVGTG